MSVPISLEIQFERLTNKPIDNTLTYNTKVNLDRFINQKATVYSGLVAAVTSTNDLFYVNNSLSAVQVPTSRRTWEQYYEVDEIKTDSLTGVDVDLSGNLRVAGTMSITSGVTFGGNTTMAGNLTVNGNTTLGSDASDEVTINAGPVKLINATAAADSLQFGNVTSCNLYKNAGNQLVTDADFVTNLDLIVLGGNITLGYNTGAGQNDGAEFYMDYSGGGDFGRLYITTRDNGNEPIIFRQRADAGPGPASYYEPLVIGEDHHVGVGDVGIGATTFPYELTVFGSISAARDIRLGGWSSLIFASNASDTNSVNLYRVADNQLKTDDSFEVGTNLFVDGNTTLGDGTGDTVTLKGGPLTLEAATAGTTGIIFGTTNSANLYRSANDTLKTDDNFEIGGTLTLPSQTNNTVFAGPATAPAAAPSFRALVAADIPSINIGTQTSGTLAIARGGTNSTTALSNDRIMVSSGNSIVESPTLTPTLITNSLNFTDVLSAAGIPVRINSTSGQSPLSSYPDARSIEFNLPVNSAYQYKFVPSDTLNIAPNSTLIIVASANRQFTVVSSLGTQTTNVVYRLTTGAYPYSSEGWIFIESVGGNTNLVFGISSIAPGSCVTQFNAGSYIEFRRIK